MKKNSKKHILFLLFLVILFIVFIIFYKKPRNYVKEYVISAYKVEEKYNTNGYYVFNVTYNNIKYPFMVKEKYLNKRNLIQKIEVNEQNNIICILPISKYLSFAPLCSSNNMLLSFNNVENDIDFDYKKIKKLHKEFNKVLINNLYNKSYLLYNYSGFYFISGDKQEDIKLFDSDNYDINLLYKYDKYLILADYNDEFYFSNFIIIDSKTGKTDKIELENKISMNSRFLGHYKKNVYLIDEKEQKEYKINIKKKEVSEVEGSIYDGKELVHYKEKTIINKKLSFYNSNYFKYLLEDKKLYQIINNEKILITTEEVSKIVYNDDESIYYLSSDKLYVYNRIDGNILLMQNFEWNFKNENMIYIF